MLVEQKTLEGDCLVQLVIRRPGEKSEAKEKREGRGREGGPILSKLCSKREDITSRNLQLPV